jgi:hypothetical protein
MLVALAIPAINAMQKSFASTGGEGMISTALSTARTLAIREDKCAGVRFQKVYDPADALKADQYMIFIIEGGTTWTCGFSAMEGYKPIKLPENIGVVDKIVWPGRNSGDACGDPTTNTLLAITHLDDVPANTALDGSNINITDISTFSIVFSPAGKLVSEQLRCGKGDDVFNTIANIIGVPAGRFAEDGEEAYGIGVEMSRREFYIYHRDKFDNLTTGQQRLDYLNGPETKKCYINAYTGELIK